MNGTVRYFRDKHGYIAPDDHSADIFVHHSDSPPGVILGAGDRVSFEIGARHNRQIAVNIKVVEAAPKPEYKPAPPRGNYLQEYARAASEINPTIPEPEQFIGSAASEFKKLSPATR